MTQVPQDVDEPTRPYWILRILIMAAYLSLVVVVIWRWFGQVNSVDEAIAFPAMIVGAVPVWLVLERWAYSTASASVDDGRGSQDGGPLEALDHQDDRTGERKGDGPVETQAAAPEASGERTPDRGPELTGVKSKVLVARFSSEFTGLVDVEDLRLDPRTVRFVKLEGTTTLSCRKCKAPLDPVRWFPPEREGKPGVMICTSCGFKNWLLPEEVV